jgi:hypothetical protein
MADEQNEVVKKRLADAKEAQEKTRREYEEKSQGKPTPTQEENDRAALGEHVVEKEADGSPEEGPTTGTQTRHAEAKPGGDYQTRAAKPAPQPAQRPGAPPRNE